MKAKSLFNCRCSIYELFDKLGDEFWECINKAKYVYVYFETHECLEITDIAELCVNPIQDEVLKNGGEFEFKGHCSGEWVDEKVINFMAVVSY